MGDFHFYQKEYLLSLKYDFWVLFPTLGIIRHTAELHLSYLPRSNLYKQISAYERRICRVEKRFW